MNPIIKSWPFRGWGMDMIGKIHPPSSKGHVWVLAITDYFTKWVEAVPMKQVASSDVVDFVREHVIHRFGIPQTITTDGGSVFVSKEFRKFCEDMGIKLIRSSPYYAQANGQAEASNKSLIKPIKRKIDEHPRRWHALMSDSIEDATELRLWSLEKIKENKAKVARAYNKKVKPKEFQVGDLVRGASRSWRGRYVMVKGRRGAADREDVHGLDPKSPQERKEETMSGQSESGRPASSRATGSNPVDRPLTGHGPQPATNRCHPDDFRGSRPRRSCRSRIRHGDQAKEDEVLHPSERLATQHNLWVQRQEFKDQLNLFETRIEQYEEVAHNFGQVNQDMNLLREATDNLHDQVTANDANMERRMDSLERAINNLGRRHRHRSTSSSSSTSSHDDYSHDRHSSSSSDSRHGDHHRPRHPHARQDDSRSNSRRGEFHRHARPHERPQQEQALHQDHHQAARHAHHGHDDHPKTTSSTTWTRHLIVKPMWMLKTKVIKIHQGVISGTILAMTKGAEDNHNMIKMRGPTLDNVNNLVKIHNNFLNMSQVKLVFTSTANPMLWLVVEDLLYHLKPQEMKASVLAAETWKMKRTYLPHPQLLGAKKVAMASLEFEEYANTWWEQVVTLREEKGEPPIDTWEDMKEEMQTRFVPTHYKTDLFNKLQKLKQGTKTVEEFFKEMELTMMRANIQEENQTIARFFNGLNYPIKRIVEFQQYSNMVELVHQASRPSVK
ncbi:hypothetical protein QYE76_020429 [Lolium multiflorum]|uniref:Integrase catalytic domain-containing protein n=1 Tax=Lolium multiflorum TaxID=4521 RepID=A0AAD8VP76_LOLMU|nr:hypothetical protein QYE76_020429 [Lolium multiflorum]